MSRTTPTKNKRIDKKDKTDRMITVRGLITPSDWDEKGNVNAIAILTFDEDEYIVDRDEDVKQLLSLIREEVEVRGIVKKENGKKRLKVKKLRLKKRLKTD